MFGSKQFFRSVFDQQWRQLVLCSLILMTMSYLLFHAIDVTKDDGFLLIFDEINDSYMRLFVIL